MHANRRDPMREPRTNVLLQVGHASRGLWLVLLALLCAPATASSDLATSRRAGRIERVEHPASDMVVVPAGPFWMGHTDDEMLDYLLDCQRELGAGDYYCENDWLSIAVLTERQVDVDAFAIDRYEVTVAAYRACVAAGACDIAALVEGDERHLRDELPMVNVTWDDAAAFCAYAGKRLPTEAEWEKAARGTERARWPWGDHDREDGSNHGAGESAAVLYTHGLLPRNNTSLVDFEFTPYAGDGFAAAAPVGSFPWGQSPYGAYDMAGNVSEWVIDYFSFEGYEGLDPFNPVRDVHDGRVSSRVARGGSWNQPRFYGLTYHREPALAHTRAAWRGFRCARGLGDADRSQLMKRVEPVR